MCPRSQCSRPITATDRTHEEKNNHNLYQCGVRDYRPTNHICHWQGQLFACDRRLLWENYLVMDGLTTRTSILDPAIMKSESSIYRTGNTECESCSDVMIVRKLRSSFDTMDKLCHRIIHPPKAARRSVVDCSVTKERLQLLCLDWFNSWWSEATRNQWLSVDVLSFSQQEPAENH